MARIMIAEDDADVRQVLTHLLIEEGHEIAVARDGNACLDKVMADPPDLLILDIMMPGVDGYSVLHELKHSGMSGAVKVLVLTARGAEDDVERSYKLGAALHMAKPFDPDEFVAKVQQLLTLSRDGVRALREQERDRAHLLSQLESLFSDD